jgi:hypothetical protein
MMALQTKHNKKIHDFIVITAIGSCIIICSCEAIVGMLGIPRMDRRNLSNPIINQQIMSCHNFGAPDTILICQMYLTCTIHPEEARQYLHEDFPHKALQLQ